MSIVDGKGHQDNEQVEVVKDYHGLSTYHRNGSQAKQKITPAKPRNEQKPIHCTYTGLPSDYRITVILMRIA